MKYCKTCLQPSTRVNDSFGDNGCCRVCNNISGQSGINFKKRSEILDSVIRSYPRKKGQHFDCVIGVSGGKDSTRQALWVRDKLKLRPLLVCLSYPPEQVSQLGVSNISNLIQLGFDVLFSGPAPGTWKGLMKEAFLQFANWARSTELALYSSVPQIALQYEIPLIFIGENQSFRDPKTFGEKPWEYNNLLSQNTLAGGDLSWMIKAGFKNEDIIPYRFPDASEINAGKLQVIDMGWFIGDWDNLANAKLATAYGIEIRKDVVANTGDPMGVSALDEDWVTLNQMIKYYKFGFGKVTDYVNEDIRSGRMTREDAIPIVEKYDGACAQIYIDSFCHYIDISLSTFWDKVIEVTNRDLFEITSNGKIIRKFNVGVGL